MYNNNNNDSNNLNNQNTSLQNISEDELTNLCDNSTIIISKTVKSKKTVLPALRSRICALSKEGTGCKAIGELLYIPRTTVSSIVKRFNMTGNENSAPKGGNTRSKLNEEQKELIRSWVDDNCFLSLKDIVNRVSAELGITISRSCVDRCLRNFHYSVKSVLPIPHERNTQRTIDLRFIYAQKFREFEQEHPYESFVFIDDVGFKVVTRPKKGRSMIGTKATTSVPRARSRNISVVAAMNKSGMLYFKIFEKPVNVNDFQICINELLGQCSRNNILKPILVLDNCRIHHSRILDFSGFILHYLPPYCPFLNPIKKCFSK